MPIFDNLKQIYLFFIAIFMVFSFNLVFYYIKFYVFLDKGEHKVVAKVEKKEQKINKNGKKYTLLLLESDEFKFYTSTFENTKINKNDIISLTIFNIDLTFFDYLKGNFYLPSSYLEIINDKFDFDEESELFDEFVRLKEGNSLKTALLQYLNSSHDNKKMAEFYGALFLATPISSELRADIVRFGIAHLIAISGYHLGLILTIIYFSLNRILAKIYDKFYTYRDYKFDILIFSFVFISFYFWILGLVPSFFRAFLMFLFGSYLLLRNIKVLNFLNLSIVIAVSIALFPDLIFNIGFYFSCIGVFYIFLYLHYFKDKFSSLKNAIYINFYLFFVMQIPVLYFFPTISFQQLFAIPLTFLFTIFYPLSLLLHIFGIGGFFDKPMLDFINLDFGVKEAKINIFLFLIFNLISIFAIKFKSLILILPLIGAFIFFKFA